MRKDSSLSMTLNQTTANLASPTINSHQAIKISRIGGSELSRGILDRNRVNLQDPTQETATTTGELVFVLVFICAGLVGFILLVFVCSRHKVSKDDRRTQLYVAEVEKRRRSAELAAATMVNRASTVSMTPTATTPTSGSGCDPFIVMHSSPSSQTVPPYSPSQNFENGRQVSSLPRNNSSALSRRSPPNPLSSNSMNRASPISQQQYKQPYQGYNGYDVIGLRNTSYTAARSHGLMPGVIPEEDHDIDPSSII